MEGTIFSHITLGLMNTHGNMDELKVKLYSDINWELLRDQKQTLFEMIVKEGRLSKTEELHLEGILNLLDAIQDEAIELGFDEDEVMNDKQATYTGEKLNESLNGEAD